MSIKFLVCGDVKAPKRNDGDAGFDFFVPKYSEQFIADLNAASKRKVEVMDVVTDDGPKKIIRVPPHTDILIPSYIRSLVPHNVALVAMNKSGVATKKHFDVGATVVDHSYEGIIHIHVHNVSNKTQHIDFDQKLVQFVPLVIEDGGYAVVEGLSPEEFYKDHASDRGAGGFGSTGLK